MIGLIYTGATVDEAWPLVRDFHYSRRMAGNVQHVYAARTIGGLFGETGDLVACAVFSIPPTRWGEPVLELTRLVRHPDNTEPLSRLLSFSAKRLRIAGQNLLVSFADWTQQHHGGIYQAAGWNYGGKRARAIDGVILDGVFIPGRSCNSKWGTRSPDALRQIMPNRSIEPHYDEGKHLYWLPLHNSGDRKAKRLGIECLAYPKPNAARPMDEQVPTCPSKVQPLGAAPSFAENAA